MNRPKNTWQLPLRRLERALAAPVAGRERPWAVRLGSAVGELARALDAHTRDADAPDGVFTEVDLTRPSLVRQVGHLRREHTDLLAAASRLQEDARNAAEAFTFPASPGAPAPLPPVPSCAGGVPDFGRLRQEAEWLLRAVRRHQEVETCLVLESVTTDIGVGD
jgi:hypothetical protein